MKKTIGLFIVISLLLSTTLDAGNLANIIYVDSDAPGDNSGTSWFNAFNYLQDALASAQPGCTIRVAQGIYYPDQTSLAAYPGGRISTFQMRNSVSILGGYAGYGTPKPWERDINQFETVLCGDLLRNDLLVSPHVADENLLDAPQRQDNAYSVVMASGVDKTAVLDGFTIMSGNASLIEDAFPYTKSRGGGLFAYGGNPSILHCTFKANAALSGGGGVYNYMTEASYTECTLLANYSAAEGGGMSNSSSDPNLQDCTFARNRVYSQAEGGGLHNYDSNPTVSRCFFTENDGGCQGGGMYNAYSDALVIECQFISNGAQKRGGGVYNATGSSPEFVDCTLRGNLASEWGGGMVNYYCAPTLINCTIQGNQAHLGAGLYNRYSDPIVVNCQFVGNRADQLGGGFGCHDTEAQIINCTFWANQAQQGRSVGCASYTGPSSRSRLNISNCILWNPGDEIFNGDNSEINIRYSTVHGGWPGPGNLQANPLFRDPLGPDQIPGTADDNLRLSSGSPAIDAGDNLRVPEGITTDLDDGARFLEDPFSPNTGNGQPPIVDMGCYEFKRGPQDGGNSQPIADAGPPQMVWSRVNGMATVNLDGSASYDLDGDPLQYFWHWIIDSTPYEAKGVTAQVQMPVGEHAVQLILSDGIHLSAPAFTLVGVSDYLRADAWIWPYDISRSSTDAYINVYIVLVGVTMDEVDLERSLTLYPGTLKAAYLHPSQSVDGIPTTTLFGMFDRFELVDVVKENGPLTLTIAGRLTSGQSFSGQDSVTIVP